MRGLAEKTSFYFQGLSAKCLWMLLMCWLLLCSLKIKIWHHVPDILHFLIDSLRCNKCCVLGADPLSKLSSGLLASTYCIFSFISFQYFCCPFCHIVKKKTVICFLIHFLISLIVLGKRKTSIGAELLLDMANHSSFI